MRTRFEPMRPWTRSHEKFADAWGELGIACAASPWWAGGKLSNWLFVRWGVHTIRELTPAQARAGCRQLNAWRASVEGRTQGFREYPRQWRRNRRVAAAYRTASKTAGATLEKSENLIVGVALAGLGRLMPTESDHAER
jgi:hypothetical protein